MAGNVVPSVNPLVVNIIASLFGSDNVILSNLASRLPLLVTVISYSILSPGETKFVSNEAVNVPIPSIFLSPFSFVAVVAPPTIFFSSIAVMAISQFEPILDVPFMFNILLKAAYAAYPYAPKLYCVIPNNFNVTIVCFRINLANYNF